MFLNITRANARIAELESELAASRELVEAAAANETAVAELTEKLATAEASVNELTGQLATLGADNAELASRLEDREARVATLEGEAQSAESRAADIVTEIGIEAAALPAGDEPAEISADQIRADFAAMPRGPERTQYFQKHRKALLG